MKFAADRTTSSSSARRIVAVILSLVAPGAGHFLLGAFRRGAAWAAGLVVLSLVLLFALPISFLLVVALAMVFCARVGTAIDVAKIVDSRPGWWFVILGWVGLFVGGSLLTESVREYHRNHYAQAFKIPSGAMEPTLLVGDHIWVDRSAYRLQKPQRGDIVVFPFPQDESRDFIKRVIGVGGDDVYIKDQKVYISCRPPDPACRPIDDPWGNYEGRGVSESEPFGPVHVPPESYFVLGDNRNNSQDSRYWGFVKREKIKGRAVVIYWSWDSDRLWFRFGRIGRSL